MEYIAATHRDQYEELIVKIIKTNGPYIPSEFEYRWD